MRQRVARLKARWWASLTMVKANSSRLQRVAGRSCVSVLLLASVTTCRRSSGGKAPGSAGARCILEAGQAGRGEAFAPLAHGMPVALALLSELLVRGVVVGGGVEDDAASESQG